MRRWVLLLVALALAAGPTSSAPAAQADSSVCGGGPAPCIAVTEAGTATPQFVTASQLTDWSDIPMQPCSTRRIPYETPIACDQVSSGLSVQVLLSRLPVPIPLDSVQLLQVQGHAGAPSTLTGDEVNAPTSPFAGGLEPVFSLPGPNNISYERPLLVSDADTNATDGQYTDDNGEMDVTVYTAGQILHPTVTVDPTHVQVGQSITATAGLAPGESTAGVTYNWNFYAGPVDENDPSDTVIHTYAKGSAGTAYVSVSVQRGVGTPTPAYGVSGPVLVHVGKPAKTPAKKHHHPGTGTGKKKNPKVGPNKGKGKHPGGAPGHSNGTSSTKPKATTPTPTRSPSSASAPASTSPSGATAVPTGSTTTTSLVPAGRTSTRSSKPPSVADFGALVHGTVIDGAARQRALTPSLTPPATASQATAPSARQRSAQPFDAKLLWWLLLPVLLGLGVLSEIRRPGPRRNRSA